MKLKLYNGSYAKFKHNNVFINIPQYKFNKNDLRGCWISNVNNIDTPICVNVNEYQAYLIGILDNMAAFNLNHAFFQVRSCNDSYYPSKLNPWSRFITGKEGKDPGFDVFKFFIDEAKKRNILVHAWINPYRVTKDDISQFNMTKDEYLESLSSDNFARKFKHHTIMDNANQIILRPSHPEVISFINETIKEIIENYDIVSIHMDDFFYPYSKLNDLDEMDDYLKYRENEKTTLKEFRINNVNKLINSVNKLIKNYNELNNKNIMFGISPFPIYRTHSSIIETGWEKGSYNSKNCFQCYEGQYSDVYRWMKEGWIDYVVPQDYFSFGRSDVTYHDICDWWSKICLETNTILYIGHSLHRVGSVGKHSESWQDPKEIYHQLSFNQNYPNISGSIMFTYNSFIQGKNKILDQTLTILKKIWKE